MHRPLLVAAAALSLLASAPSAEGRRPKLLDAPGLRIVSDPQARDLVHLLPDRVELPRGGEPTVWRYRNTGEVRVRHQQGEGDQMRVVQTTLKPLGGRRFLGETSTWLADRGWTSRYFTISRRNKVRVVDGDALKAAARRATQRAENRGRRGKTSMTDYLGQLHAHLPLSQVPANTRRVLEGEVDGHLRLTDTWQGRKHERQAITDTYRLPDGWRLGFTGHYAKVGSRLELSRGAYFSVSPDGRHVRHMTSEQAQYVRELGRMPRSRTERRAFRARRGAWVPSAQPTYQDTRRPPLAVLAPGGYDQSRLDRPEPLRPLRRRGEAGATPSAKAEMTRQLKAWNARRARGTDRAVLYDHAGAEPREGVISRMPRTYQGSVALQRSRERLQREHRIWERTPSFAKLVGQASQLHRQSARGGRTDAVARSFLAGAVEDFVGLDHGRLAPSWGERLSAVWPNVTALIRALGRTRDPGFALPLLARLEAKAGRRGGAELTYGEMGTALMDAYRRLGDKPAARRMARRVLDSFVSNHVLDYHEYSPVALSKAMVLARRSTGPGARRELAGKLRAAVDKVTSRTSYWARGPRKAALERQLRAWQGRATRTRSTVAARRNDPHYRAYRFIKRQGLPARYQRQLLGALMESGSRLQLRTSGENIRAVRIRRPGRGVLSLHRHAKGPVLIKRSRGRTVRHRVVGRGAGGHFVVSDVRRAGRKARPVRNRFVRDR